MTSNRRGYDPKKFGNVDTQLAELEKLDYRALKAAWLRWYQVEPPVRISRKILLLGVGWKIQEQAFGGFSRATRRRLTSISQSIEKGSGVPRDRAAMLKPGTRLVREWHGETYTVLVTDTEFEWRDQTWGSLSIIARQITGQRWSGPRFFGLRSTRMHQRTDKASERRGLDAG